MVPFDIRFRPGREIEEQGLANIWRSATSSQPLHIP